MARPKNRPPAIFRDSYTFVLTRLREAREERKLILSEVGEALGRPVSFVWKIERGERRLDPIDLMEFAILYNKPLAHFLPPNKQVLEENPTLDASKFRLKPKR